MTNQDCTTIPSKPQKRKKIDILNDIKMKRHIIEWLDKVLKEQEQELEELEQELRQADR